jgi:hypothetical protein
MVAYGEIWREVKRILALLVIVLQQLITKSKKNFSAISNWLTTKNHKNIGILY